MRLNIYFSVFHAESILLTFLLVWLLLLFPIPKIANDDIEQENTGVLSKRKMIILFFNVNY